VHSRTQDAASCNDCHGTHAIFSAADPRSMVNHQRVPATCGQCHEEITETFNASVHGEASTHGVREAPVCTDCHGEHRILSPLAYEDSFHGLAMRSGRATVANCASCHGVHDILPSSDPESHIHQSRLAETCGQCHPGAGTRFAIGAVHVLQTDREHAAVYWVRMIYIWMIVGTVGGMVLHNGLDFYRKFRNGIRHPHPDYVVTEERMMLGFRIAHILLMTSFAVLVYTGFALKYPESWWAAPLLRWEESFALRGWLHRAAAIVMLLAIGFHLVHLALSRRGRSAIAMMRPSWDDVHEFRDYLMYFLGRLPQRPRTPVLGYPEKLEYIALMWGMLVMTVTGFVLWFENPVLRLLPSWVADISTVIHFYEAVLATLAIVVWHFYFVMIDPVVYPMDTAWLTGRSHPGRLAERATSEVRSEIMPKPRRRNPGPPALPKIRNAAAGPGAPPTG
jgi:cytochrome b subunit of formate dehydrogenase